MFERGSVSRFGSLKHGVRSALTCQRSRAGYVSAVVSTLQEIERALRRLSDKERLRLAEALLDTLPPPSMADRPDDILAEAIRRDVELEDGQAQPLSEEAFWNGVRRRQG